MNKEKIIESVLRKCPQLMEYKPTFNSSKKNKSKFNPFSIILDSKVYQNAYSNVLNEHNKKKYLVAQNEFQKSYSDLSKKLEELNLGLIYTDIFDKDTWLSFSNSEILIGVDENSVHKSLEKLLNGNLSLDYKLNLVEAGIAPKDINHSNSKGIQVYFGNFPKDMAYAGLSESYNWHMNDVKPFSELTHFVLQGNIKIKGELDNHDEINSNITIILGDLSKLKRNVNYVNYKKEENNLTMYLN